jgi:surfactin synthase thioesterase subunit
MTGPWFTRFVARARPSLRLFCFSYAGAGGAVYRPFAIGLPDDVEVLAVQLPGRESRLREPPLRSMAALVDALATALAPQFERPFAFFGHSMGALVAFELARHLQARNSARPEHLLVSGRRAPHLPETDPAIHHLPEEAFIAEINRRYGGIPAELLEHRDLLDLLLPALRADMAAIETHRFAPGAKLACPISCFGGTHDPYARREQLVPWGEHTSAKHQLRQFEGAHFYFNDAGVRRQLLAEVAAALAPHRAAAAGASIG